MKVLVLGGGGQLGGALAARHVAGLEVVAPTHAQLDITDAGAIRSALDSSRFDWIVNAAAYTAVDLAEDEPAKAAAVNADAVRLIAEAAALRSARLLHVSTDFVFDGRSSLAYLPGDATHPLGVYGRTKLDGERCAQAASGNIVLRTSWVYASRGRNFVLTMLRLLRERDHLRVVRDQIGSPTWAVGLAQAIAALVLKGAAGGLYHWCDAGVASWYDFAVAIQEEALARGLLSEPKRITPIRTDQYPTRAQRPAFSVLNCDSTQAAAQLTAAHWRENLRNMLDELRSA